MPLGCGFSVFFSLQKIVFDLKWFSHDATYIFACRQCNVVLRKWFATRDVFFFCNNTTWQHNILAIIYKYSLTLPPCAIALLMKELVSSQQQLGISETDTIGDEQIGPLIRVVCFLESFCVGFCYVSFSEVK